METITSLQNNRIKNVLRLSEKSRERREQGLFVIEGARELSLAQSGNYKLDSVFICPSLFARTDYPKVTQKIDSNICFEVSETVFSRIAYRENSDGILALAKSKTHNLNDLTLTKNPFIIVLEAVEKPGNLGAILRTTDAAAVDALIVCDLQTDIYNPNTVRSSVGCIFTVPIAVANNAETLDFLRNNNIRSFAAELQASSFYQDADFTKPSAIVMGTEANGLSRFWLDSVDERIKIAMRGKIDSLNVSVSTAVITFEAMRQRETST
ncbi:MAG: RNA methyltransferase [Dysgonamonadaceae bacterium]|jgi:TrmH family RNA methyltransferase|nr:RNA methyltransferase [Dysgonamonadaceae bacterium]